MDEEVVSLHPMLKLTPRKLPLAVAPKLDELPRSLEDVIDCGPVTGHVSEDWGPGELGLRYSDVGM